MPIDVSRLKTYPLQRRHSKVRIADFATPWKPGCRFGQFLEWLPDILAVKTLRAVALAIGQTFATTVAGMAAPIEGPAKLSVVGVVPHLRLRSLVEDFRPQIFVPWRIAQRNPTVAWR